MRVFPLILALCLASATAQAATGVGSSADIKRSADGGATLTKGKEQSTAQSKGHKTSDSVSDQTAIARNKKDGAQDSVQLALDADAYLLPLFSQLESGIGPGSGLFSYCKLQAAQPWFDPRSGAILGCGEAGAQQVQETITEVARCMVAYAMVARETMKQVAGKAYASPKDIESGMPTAMKTALVRVLADKAQHAEINAAMDSVECAGLVNMQSIRCSGLDDGREFAYPFVCTSSLGAITVDPETWTAKISGQALWPGNGSYLGTKLTVAVAASKGSESSASVSHNTSKSRDNYTDRNAATSAKSGLTVSASRTQGRAVSGKAGTDASLPAPK